MTTKAPLAASFSLGRGAIGQVGASRIALLEAIRDQGSIQAAAKAVGLSYKGAWDSVQALNNLFDRPLVLAHPGGRGGGATTVTAEGETLVAAFRAVGQDLARTLSVLEAHLADGTHFDAVLWRLSMKTSARNALAGTIAAVIDGAVNAEVSLDIGEGQTVVAVVTRESVADLGLAPGRRAIALIKSSFVILAPGDEAVRSSARNHFRGEVSRREDGAVNSEIVLSVGEGKTLTAVVTRQSAEDLDLRVGSPVSALIKASHVILMTE
ncbi:MAG TPA: TOBE domain-containing protein [Caulobacteraceae bacterium]|jgi:molybdate transport system regulatory protein